MSVNGKIKELFLLFDPSASSGRATDVIQLLEPEHENAGILAEIKATNGATISKAEKLILAALIGLTQ